MNGTKLHLGLLFSRLRPEEKLLIRTARQHPEIELTLLNSRELILSPATKPELDLLLDREISQSRALCTLRLLQHSGVVCVNRYQVVRICGDKLFTSKALRDAGVLTPEVKIAFNPESALAAIEALGYPVVLKPVDGSWGRLMAKIENRTAAEAILEHKSHLSSYYHSIFYLQKYLEKPGRDIRAFVIGAEVVGATYRLADHWITNAAQGGRATRCPLTPQLEALCLQAARAVGGGALAIDLMETPEGYTVHEINCAMEFKESFKVLGAILPTRLIDYCIEQARSPATTPTATEVV